MEPKETLDQIGLRYVENFCVKKVKMYLGGDKTSVGHNFTRTYDILPGLKPWVSYLH